MGTCITYCLDCWRIQGDFRSLGNFSINSNSKTDEYSVAKYLAESVENKIGFSATIDFWVFSIWKNRDRSIVSWTFLLHLASQTSQQVFSKRFWFTLYIQYSLEFIQLVLVWIQHNWSTVICNWLAWNSWFSTNHGSVYNLVYCSTIESIDAIIYCCMTLNRIAIDGESIQIF